MIAALKNRSFALLWLGGLVSVCGDWMLITALPFFVFARTGSTLAAGGMFAVLFAPWLVFGSVAGVFVDRWDRRRTMLVADGARALLLTALLLVQARGWLWVVYVVAFVEQSIGTFFGPAKGALIPSLVPEENLMAANSLSSVSDNFGRLVAPGVGGALLGLTGLSSVVLADSATYLFSAAMIVLIAVPRAVNPLPRAAGGSAPLDLWRGIVRDWVDGIRVVRGTRVVAGLFGVVAIAVLGDSILTGVLVPYVKSELHAGSAQFGWLMSVRGAGGLLGAVVVGRLGRLFAPGRLIALSMLAIGCLLFIAALWPVFALAMVLFAMAGVPAMGWVVGEQTLLQTTVDDAHRGRVFAAFGTTAALVGLLGISASSWLAAATGVLSLLAVGGILYFLAGVVAIPVLAREHDERVGEPAIGPAA